MPLMQELNGTPETDRLVSDPNTMESNILSGFEGDDVLIARATDDILNGGPGDDAFFREPGAQSVKIIPGEGSDVIAIRDEIFVFSEPAIDAVSIMIEEPRDEDIFIFYRNDLGVLEKPFVEIRSEIL